MTLYQSLVMTVDSLTESTIKFEKDGVQRPELRAMIEGAQIQLDCCALTIETAGYLL